MKSSIMNAINTLHTYVCISNSIVFSIDHLVASNASIQRQSSDNQDGIIHRPNKVLISSVFNLIIIPHLSDDYLNPRSYSAVAAALIQSCFIPSYSFDNESQ